MHFFISPSVVEQLAHSSSLDPPDFFLVAICHEDDVNFLTSTTTRALTSSDTRIPPHFGRMDFLSLMPFGFPLGPGATFFSCIPLDSNYPNFGIYLLSPQLLVHQKVNPPVKWALADLLFSIMLCAHVFKRSSQYLLPAACCRRLLEIHD